jgi:hypothetical protein
MRKTDLIGRKIVAVDWGRFATGQPQHPRTTQPMLTLDNGRKLHFIVCETETGEYGVEMHITKPQRTGEIKK